ncbi:bis(5'-nucleosyl)-tetraphosphatase [asymmetrical], putative [Plasmodium vivax]|uniref:Bis(5'-nucleosyl)-tetraphosphatase [asymmetrical] n=6 Tax=Plasmodium vivax TaxID=5855 RepID=A5K9F2_PLAVS|nr:BIS(5'-nucleosyl)-tetraphosphatase, putative [Plasmodium vivax]KMZ80166.1 BIS(5'-nucleosyl)-tetraphosphatase [Plasmodium vivax India VII]KMZ86252.1 BIS(5'-nucleosyl)-tetraphosphatase [Plasmodium vivax Brazil I]KMZ92612.1 BIS(5'-nucleosyl)-tetraphosphatase [Plasmodium vivax Mauritania I]KMZ99162.1 BIS(5'-nucleosyl)-tetraphosphatase [Plasmodium vivax North Korean]EDL44024.1 BIS(5'-nucleosyl)-tetraphosphatase, putative [Plasmodium vivax]|eukprot:XP_001613751.1 BIS(5'-nucleosyl)-tetraphosphatase [Plasmodium vivax Sal-1]
MRDSIIKAYGVLLCRVLYSGARNFLGDDSRIEFLFLKASYGNRHWTPPKGLHENNEDGLDTALRETLEETGLDRDKYKLLNYQKTLKYMVEDSLKETTYYLALLLNNEERITLSDEHTDYKWIHSDESATYALPGSLTDLLTNAEDFLKNNEGMIMSS